MASSFLLDILTPEKEFFSGEVSALIVPASDGELGIEAGHLPLVTTLEVGNLRFRKAGEEDWLMPFNSEGFLEVRPDGSVVIYAQACEWPEDIDAARAEEALRRANEKLRQKRSMQEYKASKISLARAMARLKTAGEKSVNNK